MGFISDLLIEITSFRIRVGNKLNKLWEDIGNKATLTTTDKSSLVNAINEVNGNIPNVTGFVDLISNQNIEGSKRFTDLGLRYAGVHQSTSSGWHRIAKVSGRGYFEVGIHFLGGAFTPSSYILKGFLSWSNSANQNDIQIDTLGRGNYIRGARIVQDGDIYLEVVFFIAQASNVYQTVSYLKGGNVSVELIPMIPVSTLTGTLWAESLPGWDDRSTDFTLVRAENFKTINYGTAQDWYNAYLATQDLNTNYITTNTNQTGLTGNKSVDGTWTFNSQINTANHGNSSQWKQAYDWGDYSLNTIVFNDTTNNPTNNYNGLDADLTVNTSRLFFTSGLNTPISTGFIDTTVYSNGAFQMVQGDQDNFYYRRRFGGTWRTWNQVASRAWADGRFALASSIPTVNNGQLSITTGSGLSGSVNFTANQSHNSSILISVRNTHKLPTTAEWNALPTTDTITRLRGTTSGTYTSGDLTLLAGANTTITQSGSNITIASTNTTYSAGTLALLQAGTNTSNRVWSAKILADGLIRKGVHNINPEGPQPFSIHANYGSLDWNGNGFSFITDSEQEFTYIEDEQAIGVNPFQNYGFYLNNQRLRFSNAGNRSELLPSSGVSKSNLPTTGSTQRTLAVGATVGGSTYYANENGLISLPNSVVDTTVKAYLPGDVFDNDTIHCSASKTIIYLSPSFTGPLHIEIEPDLQDGAELIVIHTYEGDDTSLFNMIGEFISHKGQLISTYPASQGKTYRFIHVKDLERFALVDVGTL